MLYSIKYVHLLSFATAAILCVGLALIMFSGHGEGQFHFTLEQIKASLCISDEGDEMDMMPS